MKRNNKIGILGLWHLGSVYSACLAKLGFSVTGWDFDERTIKNLKKGSPPIKEPLLKETIKKYLNKNLFFSTHPQVAIQDKKYVFITCDVPVDEHDKIDLTVINRTFSLICKYISPRTTLVISSQLPVGYSRKSLNKLKKKDPSINIIYFPENLRLGTALHGFLKPDRIIIGSDNQKALDRFEQDFGSLRCPFIKIGLESAEMAKHALNIYLATMVSFSSEIGDLCELLGADLREVIMALKTEKRISPFAPINPGLGFAGGTLGRDIQTLKKLAKSKNYDPLLLNSIYQVNENRMQGLVKKIKTFLPSLRRKKIGILGLTYKPGTNTLRRSMSLELTSILKKEGASITALDPVINNSVDNFPYIRLIKSHHEFFQDLDLVVLMTEWQEFRQIDWVKSGNLMRNKFIIDTKNFLDSEILEKNGFKYKGTGFE